MVLFFNHAGEIEHDHGSKDEEEGGGMDGQKKERELYSKGSLQMGLLILLLLTRKDTQQHANTTTKWKEPFSFVLDYRNLFFFSRYRVSPLSHNSSL